MSTRRTSCASDESSTTRLSTNEQVEAAKLALQAEPMRIHHVRHLDDAWNNCEEKIKMSKAECEDKTKKLKAQHKIEREECRGEEFALLKQAKQLRMSTGWDE